VTTPADFKKLSDALAAASSAADQLQLRSFPLGYNIMKTVGIAQPGDPAKITFHVRRIDHLSFPTSDFDSVAEVEAHLDHLATLPRYRLDLVDNREVVEEPNDDHPFTTIRDAATGEEFHVRVIDIEAATTLYIHAEEPPSANWHLDQ
jgi:hypothetical protein